MKIKKCIIFLIEGNSDKFYIESILRNIPCFYDNYVTFYSIEPDPTSSNSNKANNIKGLLINRLNRLIRTELLSRKDIIQIVQVVDTDGAFVKDEIYEDINKHFYYTEDCILSDNVDKVMQRNGHKRKLLNTLIDTQQLDGIPYSIFFMSSNIEHVFWGKDFMNIGTKEKIDLVSKFIIECEQNDDLIKAVIKNQDIAMNDYISSWQFIKDGNNSLKRKTNFSILLESLEKNSK